MRWLILFGGVMLFASESGGTDIIPRTINFLIFAAILWYLVGDKVKEFFTNRKEEIAKRFQDVERKLKESKALKEEMQIQLNESKKISEDIIATAKKEAEIIKEKIAKELEEELKLLDKHFEDFKESEIKKSKEEVLRKFLAEVLKDIHITSDEAAKIILKVA
jgi:F-type H+-transporting ATPase subunit b